MKYMVCEKLYNNGNIEIHEPVVTSLEKSCRKELLYYDVYYNIFDTIKSAMNYYQGGKNDNR